jgi:subtilisin family serine protease
MVAQFDSRNEHDAERFPVDARPTPSPEPVVQIRLDPDDAPDVPSMSAMMRFLADLNAAELERSVGPRGTALMAVLRELGAISIGWSLDDTAVPDLARILTPEERSRRRAIVDVTFRPGIDLRRAAVVIRAQPGVKAAVPLPVEAPPFQLEPLLGQDDQDLTKQWYVFRIRADQAWCLASGKSVVIGDVDFGFRTTHQDLTNIEIAKAYNSHDGSANVSHGTRTSHGTAVLGLAGAARNTLGMVGIAFDANLWPIQANSGAGPRIPGDKWGRGTSSEWRSCGR